MVCPAPNSVKASNFNSFFNNPEIWKSSCSTTACGTPTFPHLDEMLQVCLTLFLLPIKERILSGNYEDFNLAIKIFEASNVVQLLHDRKYSIGTSKKFDVIKKVRIYFKYMLHA